MCIVNQDSFLLDKQKKLEEEIQRVSKIRTFLQKRMDQESEKMVKNAHIIWEDIVYYLKQKNMIESTYDSKTSQDKLWIEDGILFFGQDEPKSFFDFMMAKHEP